MLPVTLGFQPTSSCSAVFDTASWPLRYRAPCLGGCSDTTPKQENSQLFHGHQAGGPDVAKHSMAKGDVRPRQGGGAIRRRGGRQRKYNSDIADEGSFKAPGSRNGGGVVDG